MPDLIENAMVNDRCWPAQKPRTEAEEWDAFETEAKFHSHDWSRGMTPDEMRSLIHEVVNAGWRDPSLKTDEERMARIKQELECAIEAAFEREGE